MDRLRVVATVGLLLLGCQASPTLEDAPATAGGEVEGTCTQHGLPEALCTRCNPALEAVFRAQGDWCAEHDLPGSICPTCGPSGRVVSGLAGRPGHGPRIRFRSPSIELASGIAHAPARDAAIALAISCTARLEFNRDRLADIRAPIAGIVRELNVELGQRVDAGTELFVLESPDMGDLQGRLRAARQHVEVARANLKREEDLHASRISSDREVELARQEHETELAELRALEASVRIGGASTDGEGGRYTLRSPLPGTVVRRPATVGTYATAETSLATVADTSTIWGLLDLREHEATRVAIDQRVSLTVEGLPGRTFSGRIAWVSSEVDPRTRTVTARAEFPNPDAILRAHQFARATIHVAPPAGAVVVPGEAIQRLDEGRVVFVRAGQGVYDTVPIELGRSEGDLVEVIGPVEAEDQVVTTGAYLLKTELLKDSIGAGCCEVEAPRAE